MSYPPLRGLHVDSACTSSGLSEMETMINVTPKAVEKIRETLARHHATGGLRLGAAGGGCSGLTYKFKLAAEPRSTEPAFALDGVKLFVDPKCYAHPERLTLD